MGCVLGCVLGCMLSLMAVGCGIASLFIDRHVELVMPLSRRHLIPMHKINHTVNAM